LDEPSLQLREPLDGIVDALIVQTRIVFRLEQILNLFFRYYSGK